MMLSRVREFLEQRGEATLQEIALHLNAPVEAAEGMLQTLERKGRVRQRSLGSACGSGCSQCDTATTQIYQLVEAVDTRDQERPISPPPGCKL